MAVIDDIRGEWGWTGIDPVNVFGENAFGNLIVEDRSGQFWRLCPEECSCQVVAADRERLADLLNDDAFLRDWNMTAMVGMATEKLGVLPEGRKYCLKIPAALGGKYASENMGTISLGELIGASGHIARQIQDLPDGATIRLAVREG
jgi:hypothetical protein